MSRRGEKVPVDEAMKQMIDDEFADLPAEFKKELPDFKEVYRLQPTPDCPSGTKGRVAAFEVFDMTTELERAILAGKSEDDLRAIVRKQGMLTMKEDAMIKSARGEIPFEEVNTLGGEFEFDEEVGAVAKKTPVALTADGAEEEDKSEAAPEDKPKIEI